MRSVVKLCMAHRVSLGAHPGYPDREQFGRLKIEMDGSDLCKSIREQIEGLVVIAESLGAPVHHVKPHGALYNAAAGNPDLAAIIGEAVSRVNKRLMLVGLAGSVMLDVWRSAGFAVAAEAFADRRYEADATLRSRSFSDSLIANPEDAGQQALSIARDGVILAMGGARLAVKAQTLCIHGDTGGAVDIAAEIRNQLHREGIGVRSF